MVKKMAKKRPLVSKKSRANKTNMKGGLIPQEILEDYRKQVFKNFSDATVPYGVEQGLLFSDNLLNKILYSIEEAKQNYPNGIPNNVYANILQTSDANNEIKLRITNDFINNFLFQLDQTLQEQAKHGQVQARFIDPKADLNNALLYAIQQGSARKERPKPVKPNPYIGTENKLDKLIELAVDANLLKQQLKAEKDLYKKNKEDFKKEEARKSMSEARKRKALEDLRALKRKEAEDEKALKDLIPKFKDDLQKYGLLPKGRVNGEDLFNPETWTNPEYVPFDFNFGSNTVAQDYTATAPKPASNKPELKFKTHYEKPHLFGVNYEDFPEYYEAPPPSYEEAIRAKHKQPKLEDEFYNALELGYTDTAPRPNEYAEEEADRILKERLERLKGNEPKLKDEGEYKFRAPITLRPEVKEAKEALFDDIMHIADDINMQVFRESKKVIDKEIKDGKIDKREAKKELARIKEESKLPPLTQEDLNNIINEISYEPIEAYELRNRYLVEGLRSEDVKSYFHSLSPKQRKELEHEKKMMKQAERRFEKEESDVVPNFVEPFLYGKPNVAYGENPYLLQNNDYVFGEPAFVAERSNIPLSAKEQKKLLKEAKRERERAEFRRAKKELDELDELTEKVKAFHREDEIKRNLVEDLKKSAIGKEKKILNDIKKDLDKDIQLAEDIAFITAEIEEEEIDVEKELKKYKNKGGRPKKEKAMKMKLEKKKGRPTKKMKAIDIANIERNL